MENEKRLIDVNDLFDRLYDNEFSTLCPLDEVCGVIDNCPTVDAVEVVRCRDCKHYDETDSFNCKFAFMEFRRPDDFCSYGERRTDGD